ncbi:SDR family oxidoreductase [bacterium]|nr:SDR family oxidoreductase [bacterium]
MGKESKIIVLTGCTRGLGKALLDQFAAQGHTVIGCGRSLDGIQRLQSEFGKPHNFSVVDVADGKSVESWANRVLSAFGAPDLLINNAAVMNVPRPLWQIPTEEFDQLIDVNIKGTYHTIRSFVPSMVARKSGAIVNFSSGWGRSVDAQVAPYCATKWGIEGLTLALAEELPSGMTAVPLNPGVIDTEMLRKCWGENAASAYKPDAWGKVAAKLILSLGPEQNGEQLAVSLSGSKE